MTSDIYSNALYSMQFMYSYNLEIQIIKYILICWLWIYLAFTVVSLLSPGTLLFSCLPVLCFLTKTWTSSNFVAYRRRPLISCGKICVVNWGPGFTKSSWRKVQPPVLLIYKSKKLHAPPSLKSCHNIADLLPIYKWIPVTPLTVAFGFWY